MFICKKCGNSKFEVKEIVILQGYGDIDTNETTTVNFKKGKARLIYVLTCTNCKACFSHSKQVNMNPSNTDVGARDMSDVLEDLSSYMED